MHLRYVSFADQSWISWLISPYSVVDVDKGRSSVKMIWETVRVVGLAGMRAGLNVVI